MDSYETICKQLRLTRAIVFHIDPKSQHLVLGASQCTRTIITNITLWITIGEQFDHASGFVVNVSEIDHAFKVALGKNNYTPKTHYQFIDIAQTIITETFSNFTLFSLKLDIHNQLSLSKTYSPEGVMIEITKKYEICAAHWLNNNNWSREKNIKTFGKCHNAGGHGHNYTVEVTVQGTPDTETGELNIDGVDDVVRKEIFQRFDHHNLNDLPEFKDLNPTVENMVQVCWRLICDKLPNVTLSKIGIWETPKTYAQYCGG